MRKNGRWAGMPECRERRSKNGRSIRLSVDGKEKTMRSNTLNLKELLVASALLLASAGSAWATPHTVAVGPAGALTFSPAALNIAAGDTVTFTNDGTGFHNVSSDAGAVTTFRCANGCDGAGGDGAPSGAAWSATVTFPTAGTIAYHCEVHGSMGMIGSITVQGATGNVPITAGFTGAWYDPAQSGHGIFLEVLPNNLLLAAWYTFTPDGTQQAWFTGLGAITNDTAVVSADLTTGGRWIPNFDPTTVVNNPWGTLTFSFTDCNHGRVDFASTYQNYGTNHMDLQRLTQPVGLACP
jgi:plastocyanin